MSFIVYICWWIKQNYMKEHLPRDTMHRRVFVQPFRVDLEFSEMRGEPTPLAIQGRGWGYALVRF